MLDGIDRALEDHRRLAARVAFDRLFAGWDTRWNEACAEYWAATCPEGELWLFGLPTAAQRPGLHRREVQEPPFELTFSVTPDNLDAAAYQEAHQGSPTLISLDQERELRSVRDFLDVEVPTVLDFYVERVEHHLARLGLPSIARPGIPRLVQDTLWSPLTT